MNDLMKQAAAEHVPAWTATVPLVLFLAFFIGVVLWTVFRAEADAPPLE